MSQREFNFFLLLYFALFHKGLKAIYNKDTNITLIYTKIGAREKGKIKVAT